MFVLLGFMTCVPRTVPLASLAFPGKVDGCRWQNLSTLASPSLKANGCRGINSLLARDEDGLNGAAVAKLKVGLDPAKD